MYLLDTQAADSLDVPVVVWSYKGKTISAAKSLLTAKLIRFIEENSGIFTHLFV